jgi:hypothetical protein
MFYIGNAGIKVLPACEGFNEFDARGVFIARMSDFMNNLHSRRLIVN